MVEFKVAMATKNSETIFCIILLLVQVYFYRCNWKEIWIIQLFIQIVYRCNWREILDYLVFYLDFFIGVIGAKFWIIQFFLKISFIGIIGGYFWWTTLPSKITTSNKGSWGHGSWVFAKHSSVNSSLHETWCAMKRMEQWFFSFGDEFQHFSN